MSLINKRVVRPLLLVGVAITLIASLLAATAKPVEAAEVRSSWSTVTIMLTRHETAIVRDVPNLDHAWLSSALCGRIPFPPVAIACGALVFAKTNNLVYALNRAITANGCLVVRVPILALRSVGRTVEQAYFWYEHAGCR